LQDYAKNGLRTLLIAERIIAPEVYLEWQKEYYAASVALVGRDEKIDAAAEKIEVDLRLIGSTAIEDLLQDQVGETIKALK